MMENNEKHLNDLLDQALKEERQSQIRLSQLDRQEEPLITGGRCK